MAPPNCLLVFSLDDRRFALRLECVEQVIRAVEITPLPGGPALVLGVVDVRGRVLPVLDLRIALGLASRELQLSDQFVVTQAGERGVVIIADEVHGLVHLDASEVIDAEALAPELVGVAGVAQMAGGLVVIEDLDAVVATVPQQVLAANE
jgi:purine-binding chemotaxis protein CheW